MASEFVATPAEYRGDLSLRVLPDRLRAVDTFAAMIAILVLAILIDVAWKRTRSTAPPPPAGEAAASKGT